MSIEWTIGKRLVLGFGLAIMALIAVGTLSYLNTSNFIDTNKWVVHTHKVLNEIAVIQEMTSNAETGVRDYIMTGKESYLEPYTLADTEIWLHIETLQSLTADNPNQQRKIPQLKQELSSHFAILERGVELRRSGGLAAISRVYASEGGIPQMAGAIQSLTEMRAEENLLLEERETKIIESAQRSMLTLAAMVLLVCVQLALVYHITRRDVEDRKKTMEALQESEDRFRRLSEAAFEGITVHENGKLLEVNGTLAAMLGYEPEKLVGMTALQLAAPESHDLIKENIAAGSEKPYEVMGLRKDGTTFPLEVRGANIPYKGRTVRVAALRDVTERKRTEEALRESERKYRELMEQSSDGIIIFDNKANLVEANHEACRALGYTREALLKLNTRHIVPTKYLVQTMRAIREMREGKASLGECMLRRNDGSVFPVEISVNSVEGGQLQVVARDITERKHSEEALRESEERYASVIAALEEGVVMQNSDGSISAINASAESVLGLTASQMLGLRSFYTKWLSIHEDGTPFLDAEYPAQVTLKTGQPCSNVIMGVHKPDKTLAWLSINSQPLIRGGESKPYAVVSSFTDVTKRKQAEEALRELSIRDGLTGLYNRREMDRVLIEEVRRHQRYGNSLSLVMLDIDHFKHINDTYGHQVGDEALRWVADLVQRSVRDADRPARYGGEEFALILPETKGAEALTLAERIRQAIASKPFHSAHETGPDGKPIKVELTVSMGVACISPDIAAASDLIAASDDALYEAKREGRNRTILAQSPNQIIPPRTMDEG